jgi:prevent-host-death family protein
VFRYGARRRLGGHNGHVIKTSLAHAKAHLSALVDQAEHKNKRILILRHGKPAAAIVPVEVAAPTRKRPTPMRDEDAQRSVLAFVGEFSAAEPEVSAVDDLQQGRR